MKISGINLNLFKTKSISNVTENQQNPFAVNNTNNPFAGGLKADVFQKSSIEEAKPNDIAQKAAEIVTNMNKGVETFKGMAKEFFAPAISFAGKIQAGYQKLNEIRVEDMFANLGKEISMLTLDKDVRKYVKMPIADLRSELAKELA